MRRKLKTLTIDSYLREAIIRTKKVRQVKVVSIKDHQNIVSQGVWFDIAQVVTPLYLSLSQTFNTPKTNDPENWQVSRFLRGVCCCFLTVLHHEKTSLRDKNQTSDKVNVPLINKKCNQIEWLCVFILNYKFIAEKNGRITLGTANNRPTSSFVL